MRSQDKYRGCLIGGAAGDALGYAVEFSDEGAIFRRFGGKGITEYELQDGVARISDDTQMTLFTANGLLIAETRGKLRGIMSEYRYYILPCYRDWLKTQRQRYPYKGEECFSWLLNVPELFHPRAPGNTCLSALSSETVGTVEKPINHSKGCGGVMRVAPAGLLFEDAELAGEVGANAAALTHGHELGYIPAAALAYVISIVSHFDGISLYEAVADMSAAVSRRYDGAEHLSELLILIDRAVELSHADMDDVEAIHMLGQGWVAEETLAIALYCALKYSDDFDKALVAAVNHNGDSDSTGAVTGNILGAYLGLSAIPEKYLKNLELRDVILEIADDLYSGCKWSEYGSYRDETWLSKYVYCTYAPKR